MAVRAEELIDVASFLRIAVTRKQSGSVRRDRDASLPNFVSLTEPLLADWVAADTGGVAGEKELLPTGAPEVYRQVI